MCVPGIELGSLTWQAVSVQDQLNADAGLNYPLHIRVRPPWTLFKFHIALHYQP